MHDLPVAALPNQIVIYSGQSIHQPLARQLMGLPQDCPLLLFGVMGGDTIPRKGIVLLFDAFTHLRKEPNLKTQQLVVFGQLAPQSPPQLGFPVHYIGHLHDDVSLRNLNSATDAMLVPSR